MRLVFSLFTALFIVLQGLPSAQAPARFDEKLLDHFQYRNLGPFRAGGWVSDIAVPDAPQKAHLYTMYVAARHGGIWKTTNNGTTFEPVFDKQDAFSIGSVAVAPTNENIVWVGTGEASCARSAYSGNGVYKSTDGAMTWQHVGLEDTHHVPRIIIHPKNPDIVYVAAMGHLFTTNEQRGVFRTNDGGKTWKKVVYVSDKVGAIDLVINRRDPNVLFAAMYDFERRPWNIVEGGPGTGIYRTTDGGTTWKRLEGGLPVGKVGRIGLDVFQKNPDIVYAVVENNNMRPPTDEEAQQDRNRKIEPRQRAIGNEVYRTDDGGKTWRKMNSAKDNTGSKAAYSFNQIRVDQHNDRRIIINSDSMLSSEDGGTTWTGLNWNSRNLLSKAFGDFRTMWIDPQNSDRIIAGSDGGLHVSYDGGRTCDHYTNLPFGELYAVAVDMEDPYNIYGGLQDHEMWKGPSNGRSGSIGIEDWVTTGEGDGMYNQVDPEDSRWLYTTSQFGGHYRVDQRMHTRTRIAPSRAAGQPPYRFNWIAPIRLSPHNGRILYAGAQVLLRSLDRGDHWEEISPDLTTNDPKKLSPPGSPIPHCTITTISESPVTAGVIWTGTDDGKVQVTRNHGATWTDATAALTAAGAPADFWVTRVFASNVTPATAYVSKTGYREDDFRPLVYKTTDFGATRSSMAGNLPSAPVNVVVEDFENPELLFVGSDRGVFVSIDSGRQWAHMKANMPNAVAVHDMVIHPREADLVVGTYGRGAWVTNILPLREMKPAVLDEALHFFKVRPGARRTEGAWGNYDLYGDRYVVTPNEPNGLVFTYYLKDKAPAKATVTIVDAFGKTIRRMEGPAEGGLNRAVWNLADDQRRPLPPGDYIVTIEVNGRKASQPARIRTQGRPLT
jgi:photosystem II stability/assembly factor-like uncharacterized protein